MIVHFFLILAMMPDSLHSSDVTIEASRLFQNTLNRWGIRPINEVDRSERWRRLLASKRAVDENTEGILLESLNRLTVLNDKEYALRTAPYRLGLNITDFQEEKTLPPHHHLTRRSLPDTFDYWENTVGLHEPRHQQSCGSCWSFPNVGTIEAIYKQLTGEFAKFSEQYFVDCTFTYSGCVGGTTNDGYKKTKYRQYMMYESDHPFTASYKPCAFTSDIESGTNNRMTKIWFQDWYPSGQSEEAVLGALATSPVAIGVFVSENIFAYSGGNYNDAQCAVDSLPHSMLLVGYTETTIRVKNSYGTDWGDNGYINLVRNGNLDSCRFWKHAYFIAATTRRDFEYEWCLDKALGTRAACRKSCKDMGEGWDLAIIPTQKHNQEIVEKVNAFVAGVKSNDKFNLIWIGLQDPTKSSNVAWVDGYTPVNYANITSSYTAAKFGMLDKNSGAWFFKNSNTYTARGMCSRATNCWDITTAVANGDVTFDNDARTYGTIATVTCDTDYTISGATTITCNAGIWDQDLPTCNCNLDDGCSESESQSVEQCATVTVENAQITGASQPASSGQTITITCNTGYTLNGNSELTCDGTNFGTLPTCQQQQCSTITVENGQITPSQPVNHGVTITVTCNSEYVISGASELLCQGTTFNAAIPTCTPPQCPEIFVDNAEITGATQPATTGQVITVHCKQGFSIEGSATLTCTGTSFDNAAPTCHTCNQLTVLNAMLSPKEEVDTVSVACINNGYELIGQSSLSCEKCLDNYKTDTIMCKGPAFAEGAVPECRLRPGSCPGGTHYTEDGCETCPAGHWMAGGDNVDSGTNGCNKCPGVKTSEEGSTKETDCHYTICKCKMVASGVAGGKFRTFCSCL